MPKNEAKNEQFDQSVKQFFESMEKTHPGLAEGMRVLNMSYNDYMTILQNSQAPVSFATNGAVMAFNNERKANME